MSGPDGTGGRTKLTPERRADIVQLIEAGNYVETACLATGITSRAYYTWMATGNRLSEEYGDEYDPLQEPRPPHLTDMEWEAFKLFREATKATARAEAYAVAIVRKHMPDQWTAAMTFLERRHPQRWKRREAHEVTTPDADEDAQKREDELLANPRAVAHLHEALAEVAGELPATVDSTAEDA